MRDKAFFACLFWHHRCACPEIYSRRLPFFATPAALHAWGSGCRGDRTFFLLIRDTECCTPGALLIATVRYEKLEAVVHYLAIGLRVSREGSLRECANEDLTCFLHELGLLIHERGVRTCL